MVRLSAILLAFSLFLPLMAGEGFRWRLDITDEIHRPDVPKAYSMSGITWVSNSVYWTVTDEKHEPVVWELELPVDASSGKLGGCRMKVLSRPAGHDVEGIARDPLDGSVWLADERNSTITQYDPFSGKKLAGVVELPAGMRKYAQYAKDRGLESLAISGDGLTMWTSAEEALVADGPVSTRRAGTDVRLTRFERAAAAAPWKISGQWVYRTDSIVGKVWYNEKGEESTRSGVSELCQLEDGTLLVLEREFSVVIVPRFRCRIYETDFTGATEVMGRSTLKGDPPPKPVGKRLLCETTGFSMYEGMCVGPRLADGSRVMLLVSDGDRKSFRTVLALRLSPHLNSER